MSIFNTMRLSGYGMTAERLRMDVISNNIANSQTTRTADGGAYQRKQVVLQAHESNRLPVSRFQQSTQLAGSDDLHGVKVVSIVNNDENMVRVYEPTHPDADEEEDRHRRRATISRCRRRRAWCRAHLRRRPGRPSPRW